MLLSTKSGRTLNLLNWVELSGSSQMYWHPKLMWSWKMLQYTFPNFESKVFMNILMNLATIQFPDLENALVKQDTRSWSYCAEDWITGRLELDCSLHSGSRNLAVHEAFLPRTREKE